MLIHKAYRTELDPNNAQVTAFKRHAGAARWAYNWGLKRKIDTYRETGKSPTAIDLHKELVLLKNQPKDSGGVPWMYEVSKCAPQESLRNLDKAFQQFFGRCKKGAKKKGFPKFKSKHTGKDTFKFSEYVSVATNKVKLPRIGWVRLKESDYLPCPDELDSRILSATVSKQAGRWFVSLSVEEEITTKELSNEVLGIDVGISHSAVLSDGSTFDNSKALKLVGHKLRSLQRSMSRKVKGSNNRKKTVTALAKKHYEVANIRRDSVQKATSEVIAKLPKVICIETLNVQGMLKNHKFARSISDASMSEFLRCLEYKAKWAGIEIVRADRFFPSSKTCSKCKHVNQDLTLKDRVFNCPTCGFSIDRDLNAAINLKQIAVSSTVTACGAEGSGHTRAQAREMAKPAALKQEPNTIGVA